ncbi:hypothetical protein [Terriglobus sp. TAA 43]|uniref:hypothetical protein n=1 Tax=Terriglobus sp. TAA 43 TaxID=278961 RepID=UPI000647F039|nr:hypothetical protein [Terriglobus sp. TAA 43]
MKQLFLATLLLALPLHAQSTYSVTMTYDREGLTVPHWKIIIPEQGDAHYTGKPTKGIDPGLISFHMSATGREKLGWLLGQSNNLQPCETRSKGIANMGQKDVTYWPSGASEAHCSFNYTDNKALGQSTDYLMALANTIQTGVELDRLHRYDRLGLDAVMHRFVADVKEHRAVEVVAIQPTLQRLVEDEALMDRVRANAQSLLTLASQESAK